MKYNLDDVLSVSIIDGEGDFSVIGVIRKIEDTKYDFNVLRNFSEWDLKVFTIPFSDVDSYKMEVIGTRGDFPEMFL